MTKLFGSQLTDEQLAERRKGIGASDAGKILDGGPAWADLFLDKTGRTKDKRIMSPWDAALRHTTESLQCDWYEHKTGGEVGARGVAMLCLPWPVLRCTLDGLVGYPTEPSGLVFEAKHISEYTPDPINWAVAKYSGQIYHQMIVTGAEKGILSVIVGMSEPVWINFKLDPFFSEVYIARCREFWKFVETDTPPPGAEPLPPPIPHEDMRVEDFSTNNQFGDFAADWLENKLAAKKFELSAKGLKEMVKPDVRKAHGFGIEIARSKAGALTIKAKE